MQKEIEELPWACGRQQGKAGGAVEQSALYSAEHGEQRACLVIRGERPAAAGVFCTRNNHNRNKKHREMEHDFLLPDVQGERGGLLASCRRG